MAVSARTWTVEQQKAQSLTQLHTYIHCAYIHMLEYIYVRLQARMLEGQVHTYLVSQLEDGTVENKYKRRRL